MSISKGLSGAFIDCVKIGGTAMQIFAKSPMRSALKKFNKEEISKLNKTKEKNNIKFSVIHASYLLNFSKKLKKNSYEINSLVEDIENSELMGGNGVVVHMGKSLDMNTNEAIENFVNNINIVIERTKTASSKIILENTAGQGTELGYKLDELGKIFKKIGSKKVGVCIDTAHAFGAGYNLANEDGVLGFIKEIEENIEIKNISCIHFNDSKKPVGSKVDRHQDIGEGEIGIEGLKIFYKELSKKSNHKIPFILETTEEYLSYENQLKIIKSW